MKKIIKILAVCAIVLLTSACRNKNVTVLVTNYPVEFLFEKIGQGHVEVINISEGTMPQKAQAIEKLEDNISKGDALFYIQELEPYFQIFTEDFKNNSIQMFNLSERSSLYPFKRFKTVYTSNGEISTYIEEGYYQGDAFENVDVYQNDPMLWLDPVAMTSMARTVKDWLTEKIPNEAAFFQQNFSELEVELTKLQAEYQSLRDSNFGISFASMSPSFGNWQKSFNVEVYPVILSKYGALPNESQLNIVRETIMSADVQYIAYEENMPEEYAHLFNQLKKELDLTQINLSNLFVLSEQDRKDNVDYIDKMYQNLETLEAMIHDR